MAVKNVECQLAQGQIARYLAGDSLGPDVAVELRKHVLECEECASVLERKRGILQAMMGAKGDLPTHAAILSSHDEAPETDTVYAPPPAGPDEEPRLAAAWRTIRARGFDIGQRETFSPAAPVVAQRTANIWRALAYSVALAGVLLLMALVLQNPTGIFGDRALDANSTEVIAAGSAPGPDNSDSGPSATSDEGTHDSESTSLPAPSSGLTATPLVGRGSFGGDASSESANAGAAPTPSEAGPGPGPVAGSPNTNSSLSTSPRPTTPPTAERPKRSSVSIRARPVRPQQRASGPARPTRGIRVYDADGKPLRPQ